MNILLGIVANALALFGVHYLLGDMGFSITPDWGYVLVGTVLGIVNVFVKPVLPLISLPLIFLTMGIFLAIINGFLLFAIEYIFANIIPDVGVVFVVGEGWITYLIVALVLSLFNSITHFFLT